MALVYNFGLTDTGFNDGETTQSWSPHQFGYGGRVTFGSAGTVDQIGTYCRDGDGGTKAGKAALYDTSGNLIANDTFTFPSAQAWADTATFTAVNVSAADYITLFSCEDTKGLYGWDSGNDGSTCTENYATFPQAEETLSLETETSQGYAGRVNFTAGGGGATPHGPLGLALHGPFGGPLG